MAPLWSTTPTARRYGRVGEVTGARILKVLFRKFSQCFAIMFWSWVSLIDTLIFNVAMLPVKCSNKFRSLDVSEWINLWASEVQLLMGRPWFMANRLL